MHFCLATAGAADDDAGLPASSHPGFLLFSNRAFLQVYLLEYDPDLAVIDNPLQRLQHLVRHCPLKAVRRRINRARQRELFRQGMTKQAPATQAVLTSLMNELTSLPASSMTRAERSFRWDAHLFQTYRAVAGGIHLHSLMQRCQS